MQPKVLSGGDSKLREESVWDILGKSGINRNNSDLLFLGEVKVGMQEVKQLIRHLSSKPFGNTPKSVVILNGHNLSPDSQNALLKTLEEPPEGAIIIIGTDSETRLLPTVLSRCQIIRLKSARGTESEFDLEKILSSSTEERFEMIEKASNKDSFFEQLIHAYRERALVTGKGTELLPELLEAQIWRESNVNVRTILEYLMLKLPNN
jgi:DNA polymerase III delta prime subunit